jgi:hypothetical protein
MRFGIAPIARRCAASFAWVWDFACHADCLLPPPDVLLAAPFSRIVDSKRCEDSECSRPAWLLVCVFTCCVGCGLRQPYRVGICQAALVSHVTWAHQAVWRIRPPVGGGNRFRRVGGLRRLSGMVTAPSRRRSYYACRSRWDFGRPAG